MRKDWVPAFAGMSGELRISGLSDQPIIADVTASFRRRRKSLRARFAVVDQRKVIERIDGNDFEFVEIILRRRESLKSLTVRLKIWQDRVGRIDIWNMPSDGEATA